MSCELEIKIDIPYYSRQLIEQSSLIVHWNLTVIISIDQDWQIEIM